MSGLDVVTVSGPYNQGENEIASSSIENPEYFVRAMFEVRFTTPGLAAFWIWRAELGPEGRGLVEQFRFNVVKDTDPGAETCPITVSVNENYKEAQEEGQQRLHDIRWAMRQQDMDLENARLYINCGVPGVSDSTQELRVVNAPVVSRRTRGSDVPDRMEPEPQATHGPALCVRTRERETQESGAVSGPGSCIRTRGSGR